MSDQANKVYPEPFQIFVDRGLAVACGIGNFSAAHPVCKTENEHSFVVHFEPPIKNFFSVEKVIPL